MDFFAVPFTRIPGVSPLVADQDLQADVATDGSDQVEHAITVPADLFNSQLVVMIIATEQVAAVEEGALEFETKIGGEAVEDGEGNSLYGYAYVLPAPTAGAHTVRMTFADACTPATFLAVLSGVRADSGTGNFDPEPSIGTLSQVPILPPSDYAVALDFVAAVAPIVYTAVHGQTVLATGADVLSAASSFKPDLNSGVSQVTAWQLDSAAIRMHIALIFEAATTPDDPDPPPAEISDIAIWLLNEPSGATAADSVGDADGVISGSMEYGLDDLVDGADTCMAGDGIGAKIVAPHDASHELATYTLDFVAQADGSPEVAQTWLAKNTSEEGERPPGGISIDRVWNGSVSRLAAFTRDAGAGAVWIEGGATPDAQHGVANWPSEDAVRIHLVVDPTHETEPTRLYLDGTKVATSTNTQGLQANELAWSFFFYILTPATFVSFADGMIYRVRLRDLPLSDAEVAAEVAGEPAVSITHGATPASDYDAAVAAFDADLVSYWKFQNNGTDENGTQAAAFSGSPEFNVETIVDLDLITEGAAANGECIAWPGSAGTYAEAAHNASHKTAEGTIVVTFQRDTASIKSTLAAADRSTGGTSSGPGGFSIEVDAAGAPRCFLRNSAGSAVVLLGTAGDVAVNQACTAVFKWGAAGLSYAIWNASGSLVRRLTNALATGLSGTSPIRFGSWHTAGAEHDGPFGRVVWLNRRISDGEEADLARARTIVRSGGEEPPPPGPYTPFPFVTQWKPPDNHSGVTARPGYSGSNPRNASFIDPMSGLEVFRITPNRGANILINNATDTGLNMPAHLKANNNVHADRCWNADGTLLMLTDSKPRSSDPADPCQSALIDVDGTHGNSGPWRFLRAAGSGGLGDSGVTTTNFMWDPANPLRAYVFKADGMYEWWPAGAPGHGVGSQAKLYNWPSGITGMNVPQDHPCQASYDGAFWMMPCRRTSDGARGGMRLNLATGAAGAFRAAPLQVDDNSRDIAGTSPNGIDGYFNHTVTNDPKHTRMVNMVTGAMSPQHSTAQRLGEHPELFTRNGVTHLLGGGNGNWGALRYSDLTMFNMASASGVSVSHVSCRAYKDLWEIHGGGTATSGLRYAMIVVSSPGSLKGIAGLRLDFGDSEQWRYLCHHRSNRTENASEVHPMPDPTFSKVVFNSNWCAPGVETDVAHINDYIVLIPDAWRSPNNSGA